MEGDMGTLINGNEAIDFIPLKNQEKIRLETEGKL
jgi:hypothetical protein